MCGGGGESVYVNQPRLSLKFLSFVIVIIIHAIAHDVHKPSWMEVVTQVLSQDQQGSLLSF